MKCFILHKNRLYVSCSVLITATDISHDPSKLVFFNNYEDGELGKGRCTFVSQLNCVSIYIESIP